MSGCEWRSATYWKRRPSSFLDRHCAAEIPRAGASLRDFSRRAERTRATWSAPCTAVGTVHCRPLRLSARRGAKAGRICWCTGIVILLRRVGDSVRASDPLQPPCRQPQQQTQSLFSTDFPLADKILSTKGVHDEFYVKHRA